MVWIGKQGATPQIINEILRQLEEKEVVKVKILKSALAKEASESLGITIAKHTDSTLVEVRGHTIVLYKPRQRR